MSTSSRSLIAKTQGSQLQRGDDRWVRGTLTIEQIARTLGMNVRTLQRRLDEDGATFSALINSVRLELAQRYIANPKYPLGRIAELLGYSSHSAFTRWFIAQFKQTPQEVRAQNTPSSVAVN